MPAAAMLLRHQAELHESSSFLLLRHGWCQQLVLLAFACVLMSLLLMCSAARFSLSGVVFLALVRFLTIVSLTCLLLS